MPGIVDKIFSDFTVAEFAKCLVAMYCKVYVI